MNRNVQLTVEISKTDSSRDQTMTNDKLPAFRGDLKIFTRFAFKSVFRVSGRRVAWDKPVTSKRTDGHNFQVLSVIGYWSANNWYINIS